MKSANPERRQLLKAGALACIATPLIGACAATNTNRTSIATPKGFIDPPRVQNGQSWQYQRINRYNGEVIDTITAQVITVVPELRVQLLGRNGKPLSEEVYDRAWAVRQDPTYNETLIFDQAVPLLPAVMAVGRREHWQGSYRLAGSETPHPWRVSMHAAGWESVDVPAGQFDALRIDRHIHFEHHDLFRHRSRRIDTLWYAPQVNRWVMREWTGFYREDPVPFGFGGWQEEREDAVRWVMSAHLGTPIAS